MKKLLVVGVVATALVMLVPFLVLILVAGTSAGVAACQAWADQMPLAGPSSSQVTLAQANIKVSLPLGAFREDLEQVTSTGPDFISLNEVTRRTDEQITPSGYAMWREGKAVRGADGTAVLWRTDRWTQVDSGRVVMVARGPQQWDYDRAATWVTLQGTDGDQVSVISVHHMINPEKYGPNKPERQRLYREGLAKVQDLVEELDDAGPVFLAGDLNYQYSGKAAWGPRPMLGKVGMKSTMDVLGPEKTHDGGGLIDYLFFQPAVATPTAQSTEDLNSDHRLLRATFDLQTEGSGSLPAGASQPFRDLDATQTQNAGHVFAVGQREGISEHGIVIALATASQESTFRSLANDGKGGDLAPDQQGIAESLQLPNDGVGTDHGSLGIMQQQWPWWSPLMETLLDPAAASGLFYDALRQVDGWESMPLTQAAQAVQRSAHPEAYADDEPLAQALYDHFAAGGTAPADQGSDADASEVATEAGGEGDEGSDFEEEIQQIELTADEQAECRELLGIPENLSCPPTGLSVEAGLTPDALLVLRCVDQQFGRHTYGGVGDRAANPGSDHPSGRAVDVMIDDWEDGAGIDEGTEIAEWVRAHAAELGVNYIIWRAEIWSVGRASEGWRPYTHPSGATDPTNLHMDHVHVSVYGNQGTGFPVSGASAVVFPVPATMADSNQDNWGESGDNWSSRHTGTDFSVPCGTPVLASHAGTVVLDHSQSWAGPTLVKVTLGPGQLTTWYAHMQKVTVADGDVVAAGQTLGEVGEEGNSTGCHLHFEVHLKGGSIYGPDNTDPTPWLAENVGRSIGGGTTRVASLNVLGHSHTRRGGNKPGWPDARPRMQGAVQALNAAGVDLAGFQEFEPYQEQAFWQYSGGLWETYPHSGGTKGSANVVAWRTDRWALVRAKRIPIPYFGGQQIGMPYVLLRNLATGQQVWLGSFHNPADVRGPAQQWRDEATRRQAELATRLVAAGTPVIWTGDMNDKGDYYCDTVRLSPLRAANGGSAGPCRPPANMGIDWIMGSSPQVQFTDYAADHSLRAREITDHPLVTATATLN